DRSPMMQHLAGRPELAPFFSFLGDRMIFTDPPKHTRLRALVNKAFTPHVVQALAPHIQQVVDGFLDRVRPQGRMDVVADLAFPLPATVIAELLGVPPEDLRQLKQWSDEFIVFFSDAPSHITAEQYRVALDAARQMTAYFRAAVAGLRDTPRQCLLRTLELVEEAG